jgi:hypothetical protein
MVHWKNAENQEVGVFDQVPVRIEVNIKRSPPDVRVVAVNPSGNPVVLFTLDDEGGPGLDVDCLAVFDDNN